MTPTLILLNIVGGVCLLLWGLRNVRNGITRAFGAQLHDVIAKSTKNRISSFFAGIGVTAIVQSSTATALIVGAFCGQGMLTVSGGIAVMLGADVGTTLVAQFLSFDLGWLAPAFVIVGYILFQKFKNSGRLGHIGKFILGLGLMLFALGWIRQSAGPLQDSEVLSMVLQSLDSDPIFAVLIAAIITWVMHSSIAMVLLLMTLVISGVLPIYTGLAMILGANIGGAIAPFVTTLKDSPMAARVPLGNILMRTVGVIVALPFLDEIIALLTSFGLSEERLLVDFHLLFNVALAITFLPFTTYIGALCQKLMPDKEAVDNESLPRYLDKKELNTTSVALSGAMRETLRMADVLEKMLQDSIRSLRDNDSALVYQIRQRDDVIDNLYRELKMYMAEITHESLDTSESMRYMQILSFAANIESAGDTIDKSLMEMAKKKIKDRLRFSTSGWADIEKIHNFVLETMRQAHSVFVSPDIKMARTLIQSKEILREIETKAVEDHFNRIREGIPETIATSALHLDILRDYRRINSAMAALAYPILEQRGQLRSSRLRDIKKKNTEKKQNKEFE
jgi:phosphate:Na+ symporter